MEQEYYVQSEQTAITSHIFKKATPEKLYFNSHVTGVQIIQISKWIFKTLAL